MLSPDVTYQLAAGVKAAISLRIELDGHRRLLCLGRFLLIDAEADVTEFWQCSLLVNAPGMLNAVDPNGRFGLPNLHRDLMMLIECRIDRLSNASDLQ